MPERFSPTRSFEQNPDTQGDTDNFLGPQQSDRKDVEGKISRRAALKNIVALGAAMATGSKIRPEHVARTLDVAALKTREIGLVHDVERLRYDVDNLKKKLGFSTLEDISPEDLPRFRKEFKDRFSVGVKKIFGTLDSLHKNLGERVFDEVLLMRGVNSLYETLRLFGMHGKVYHFFAERNVLSAYRKLRVDAYGFNSFFNKQKELTEMMKMRVEDYLPHASAVELYDVDPLSMSAEINPKDFVLHSPVWKQVEYMSKLKKIFDEERDFFNNHHKLSLAGVFSLAKNAVQFKREPHIQGDLNTHLHFGYDRGVKKLTKKSRGTEKVVTTRKILEKLWHERMEAWDEVLVDKETQVIELYGDEERFSANNAFSQLLRRIGPKSLDSYDIKKQKNAKEDFLKKVVASEGKLTMFIAMHGGLDRIYLNDNVQINFQEYAEALVSRIKRDSAQGKKIATILDDIKIIQGTCFPYDFFKKVIGRVRELCQEQGIDTKTMKGFRFIGAGEIGGLTISDHQFGFWDSSVKEYQGYFNQRSDLRIKDVLVLEPDSYQYGDMTISTVEPDQTHAISAIVPEHGAQDSPDARSVV